MIVSERPALESDISGLRPPQYSPEMSRLWEFKVGINRTTNPEPTPVLEALKPFDKTILKVTLACGLCHPKGITA